MAAPAIAQPMVQAPAGQRIIWQPAPGFQTKALSSGADETLIGGAKGSGKSDILVVRKLRYVSKPAYKGLVTRQTFPEMEELIRRARRIYKAVEPRVEYNAATRTFTFPSGALVVFGYLNSLEDCERYQGHEWADWDHDEIGNLADERIVDTMLAELRCPDLSIPRSFMASANPGGRAHAWLKRRYVVPTLNGQQLAWTAIDIGGQVVYRSKAFIPGTVYDNPVYAKDPNYLATLHSLPERTRRYLLDGSWEDPAGMAFDMLDRKRHLVPRFDIPSHWAVYAAYDWGIAHPAVCVIACADEDGMLYVADTVWMVGQSDAAQAQTLRERLPMGRLKGPIFAGHDVFAESRKYETVESTADRFARAGLFLAHASLDRRQGYLALAAMLEWRPDAIAGRQEREPGLRFMDTPGNRRLFAQLEAMVMDPDDPDKVLKWADYRVEQLPTDIDAPVPGDDGYDALRYLIASRPSAPNLGPTANLRPYTPLNPIRTMPSVVDYAKAPPHLMSGGDPVDFEVFE